MIENAMVIGEYDARPDMTDEEEEQLVLDMEEQLCNERSDWFLDELVNEGEFAREVGAVLLSDSKDKLHDINGIFDRHMRSYARHLVDVGA
jgi:hypothetical protein